MQNNLLSGAEIPRYIKSLGYQDLKVYYDNLDQFLEDNRTKHFIRLIIRDMIANKNNININSVEGVERTWKRAAKEIYRGKWSQANTNGGRWASGFVDPDINSLFGYFGPDTIPLAQIFSQVPQDAAAPSRMAVARTLTYIQVLPPRLVPEGFTPSPILRKCWDDIKNHAFYSKSSNANINQHCIDQIYMKYKDHEEIVMPEHRLSDLSRAIRERNSLGELWDTSWRIFTFTFTSINKKTWLFDKRSKCYNSIWGSPDE